MLWGHLFNECRICLKWLKASMQPLCSMWGWGGGLRAESCRCCSISTGGSDRTVGWKGLGLNFSALIHTGPLAPGAHWTQGVPLHWGYPPWTPCPDPPLTVNCHSECVFKNHGGALGHERAERRGLIIYQAGNGWDARIHPQQDSFPPMACAMFTLQS